MCAAPGSKTAQLIEMMHAGDTDSLPGKYSFCLGDNRLCVFFFKCQSSVLTYYTMVFFCEKYAREIMSCGDLVREYSCEIMSCNSDNDDVIHEYARDITSCGDLVR